VRTNIKDRPRPQAAEATNTCGNLHPEQRVVGNTRATETPLVLPWEILPAHLERCLPVRAGPNRVDPLEKLTDLSRDPNT
jgi:hypothetical protein